MSEGTEVSISWSVSYIVLSYLTAITGSYCSIQLMEQWRQYDNPREKLLLLWLAAFVLGGCSVWCTHLTGMNALQLTSTDGTLLEIDMEMGLTSVSFFVAVISVFIGLHIASTDPFFLEVDQARRKALLVRNLWCILIDSLATACMTRILISFYVSLGCHFLIAEKVQNLEKTNMKSVVNKTEIARRIKLSALFSRPTRMAMGGVFTSVGMLGMHYMGMNSQRTNAHMKFDHIIVTASGIIAYISATAAYWILFRALTFWPNRESVRISSCLIMGVAMCGTHYTGIIEKLSIVASHASLLICYWITSLFVTKSVKVTEGIIRSRTDGTQSRADNARSARVGTGTTIKKVDAVTTREDSSKLQA